MSSRSESRANWSGGWLLAALALVLTWCLGVSPAAAITAPELRSQRSLQDLQPDMHGRNLQQQEFLKSTLAGFDLSGTDLRGAVFNSSDLRGANLKDANAIFDWAAGKGVDRKKFADTYNSFGVNGKTQRSIELTRKFDIPGTPALVINGKFITAPSMTLKADKSVDYDRFFEVVDALIAEQRKSKGGK